MDLTTISVEAPAQSPFLTDTGDFTSPSLSSVGLQHSPNSPFDSAFEIQPPSPRAPHTPSYNGSYQGSPYTTFSDFSYDNPESTEPLGLFDDPASLGVHNLADDYNPAEYDDPSSAGLLMFDMGFMNGVDSNNPQLSLSHASPADSSYEAAGSPYSHASPGSSNGHESEADRAGHSRHSSVSSTHAPPSAAHPEFSHQFDGLSVDGSFSPTSGKPPSPPRLIIQDSSSPATVEFPNAPLLNVPNGDGGLAGPQLNVVPATPVSVGGAADPATVPFQTTLDGFHQQGAAQPTWNVNPQGGQPAFNFPPASSPHLQPASIPSSDYLLTDRNVQRIRSHSDGNMMAPQGLYTMPLDDEAVFDDGSMGHLMAFTPGSSPGSTTSFHTAMDNGHSLPQRPHMGHNFTFGPPSSTVAHLQPAGPSGSTGLSPHLGAGMLLNGSPHLTPNQLPVQGQFLSPLDATFGGPTMIRRSRSDGARGHRQVRSEDFGGYQPGIQPEYPQFLAPEGMVGVSRGHRRASSGSRSDRGIGVVPGGMAGSLWGGSARSSPYPSPNASPRGPIDSIPLPDVSVRRGSRASVLGMDEGLAGSSQGIPVQKQNVTTHATKEASERRRKVDGAFTCPVPGCGSTFTRHFNLKGHMRSHNEEKPYQCKWPGCPKSFARQHDCKRHENLHLNIRPFTCDGCKKTFARMDALNRHLRSEGGLECQKHQAELSANSADDLGHMSAGLVGTDYALSAKGESDWSAGGLMM